MRRAPPSRKPSSGAAASGTAAPGASSKTGAAPAAGNQETLRALGVRSPTGAAPLASQGLAELALMSIGPDFAAALSDAELEEQTRDLEDCAAAMPPGAEFDTIQENLRVLLEERARRGGTDLLRMSIGERYAATLGEAELDAQLRLLGRYAATLAPGTAEYDAAQQSLLVLMQRSVRMGARARPLSSLPQRMLAWYAAGLLDEPLWPAGLPSLPPLPVREEQAALLQLLAGAAPAYAPPQPIITNPEVPMQRPPLYVVRPPAAPAPAPKTPPVAPTRPGLAVPVIAFLIVFLTPSEIAPDPPGWTYQRNPITGEPYAGPEEYDWVERLTPEQLDYLRKLDRARHALPETEPAPSPFALPDPQADTARRRRRRNPSAYPLCWAWQLGPPMLFDQPVPGFVRTPAPERDMDDAYQRRLELVYLAEIDPDFSAGDYHVHHSVPLFLGGLDASPGNLTVIPKGLHLRGHAVLRYQPQMLTPPPPLPPLDPDILRHPAGTPYELVGFKSEPDERCF